MFSFASFCLEAKPDREKGRLQQALQCFTLLEMQALRSPEGASESLWNLQPHLNQKGSDLDFFCDRHVDFLGAPLEWIHPSLLFC